MSQHNSRKEPTFGYTNDKNTVDPTLSSLSENHHLTQNDQVATSDETKTVSISLHSNAAPNYTFTPVVKRPASMQENKNKTVPSQPVVQDTTYQSAKTGFNFAPAVSDEDKTNNAQAKLTESNNTNNAAPEAQHQNESSPVEEVAMAKSPEIERVIPAQIQTAVTKTILTDKISPKFRRLLVVILLALALLLVFFFLKPNTPKSVEQLQEQGTTLPIEFRPVNEEEAKRAEEQAKALQAEQNQVIAPSSTAQTTPDAQTSQVAEPSIAMNSTLAAAEQTQPIVLTPPPSATETVQKPTTHTNVIYQPETKISENTNQAQPTQPKKVVSQTQEDKAQLDKLIKSIDSKSVDNKATKVTSVANVKPAKGSTASSSAANTNAITTKTLTVSKGVSLMQVFRDNNLNIADVNAMSKTNKTVNNLKAGQSVTVHLDKNNRVVEMNIGSGKFIRQGDGSYTFK